MRKFCAASLMTFCLLQMGVTATLAQSPTPGFTSLSLSAEPEKEAFAPGVPITIKVRLANLTQTEIAAQRDLNPAYGTLQVYVSHNGGEFKRYLGPGWGAQDPPAVSPELIRPGYYVSREITLLFNNEVSGRDDLLASSLPFIEAGSYAIRVELYDETFGQRIVAPAVGLQIWHPQEDGGQAIWQAVKANAKLAYFMQTGDARQTDSVIKKAERLIAGHPDNVYVKHLALALGRHYLREDKIETSIEHLKEAATADPASPLRAQALLELTESYVRKGDIEEAIKISDAAGEEFGEGEVRQEFQSLSSKLRRVGK